MAQRSSRESHQGTKELPVGVDARELMLEFYRKRDRQSAELGNGSRPRSGGVYALGISRLESDDDVYESYQVLRAAGVELSPEAQKMVDSMAGDWRLVCRIDREGRVWTASLREKKASAW